MQIPVSFFLFYLLMDLTSIPSPAADIDECSTGKAVCLYNRRCVNTFGSFYCKCQLGYELKYTSGRYNCVGKSSPGMFLLHAFYSHRAHLAPAHWPVLGMLPQKW